MENSHIISRVEQLFPEPAPWELDAASWPRRNQAMPAVDIMAKT
jgi:hypothetical protein